MVEGGAFTWTKPFWEQPIWRWDAMFAVGVRAHYYASQLAARSMVTKASGLLVSISTWAAQKHIANVVRLCDIRVRLRVWTPDRRPDATSRGRADLHLDA